ncbi:MAG: HlyD family efflux transporter periplasmic adaptor subunit [Flavobacteriaceae bacterium]|nr:HlyD family efflux transporter periplasmic adaptor subunit [Flavobacteriaceae bacterium]
MKQIFPKEIINNSVEVHRFKHSIKSKVIYGIVLLSIFGIGASLPFVFLDIYSSAKGILKSEKERNQIASLYSGKVTSVFIKENKYTQQGDTLLIIDNTIGKEKLNLISNQLEQTNLFINDLTYLSNTKKLIRDSLNSFLYQKQYLQYAQKLLELQTRYKKSRRDFKRQQKLYKKEVIAKVEYENSSYNLDLAFNGLNHFKEQQRNQWQAELTQQKNRSIELKSTLSQYKNEQENHIITASVNGTIQNLKGLEPGNFITAGTVIAEISPDTDLIAECYISPSDIGLLKIDSTVKFQVDAFNYNQWGMATGEIKSIGNDIVMINNTPMFRVVCSLDQKQLQLKNGFEGKLKKGMTLNARFYISNRSAFDLLYDKVDDWFNPSSLNN